MPEAQKDKSAKGGDAKSDKKVKRGEAPAPAKLATAESMAVPAGYTPRMKQHYNDVVRAKLIEQHRSTDPAGPPPRVVRCAITTGSPMASGHGAARSRASERMPAKGPREPVTASAGRGQLGSRNPPCGR